MTCPDRIIIFFFYYFLLIMNHLCIKPTVRDMSFERSDGHGIVPLVGLLPPIQILWVPGTNSPHVGFNRAYGRSFLL